MASFVRTQVGETITNRILSHLLSFSFSFSCGPRILCSGTRYAGVYKMWATSVRGSSMRGSHYSKPIVDLRRSTRRWSSSSFFSVRLSGCFDGAVGCFITFTRTYQISV